MQNTLLKYDIIIVITISNYLFYIIIGDFTFCKIDFTIFYLEVSPGKLRFFGGIKIFL